MPFIYTLICVHPALYTDRLTGCYHYTVDLMPFIVKLSSRRISHGFVIILNRSALQNVVSACARSGLEKRISRHISETVQDRTKVTMKD